MSMTQENAINASDRETIEKTQADPKRGRYWFYFLSGPVIYAIYFLAVYTLGEFGCLAGIQRLNFWGTNPIRLGVIGLTAIGGLALIIIGLVAYRRWRQLHEGPEDPDEDDPKFMLFVGTWLNGLFAVVTLLSAVPMFVGSACAWI